MADNVKVVEIDPVRDKLLELIRCADFHPCKGAVATIGSKFSAEFIEDIADNLIANGVTIQRWIPVTERLPEMRGDGFADAYLITDGHLGHLAYFVDGEWFFTENGEMKEPMFYDVTHWMPLPEPPKGE